MIRRLVMLGLRIVVTAIFAQQGSEAVDDGGIGFLALAGLLELIALVSVAFSALTLYALVADRDEHSAYDGG